MKARRFVDIVVRKLFVTGVDVNMLHGLLLTFQLARVHGNSEDCRA